MRYRVSLCCKLARKPFSTPRSALTGSWNMFFHTKDNLTKLSLYWRTQRKSETSLYHIFWCHSVSVFSSKQLYQQRLAFERQVTHISILVDQLWETTRSFGEDRQLPHTLARILFLHISFEFTCSHLYSVMSRVKENDGQSHQLRHEAHDISELLVRQQQLLCTCSLFGRHTSCAFLRLSEESKSPAQ